MAEESHRPLLLVDKHEKYIYDLDTPEKAVTMDYVLSESIRIGGAYWGITALDVMGRLDPQTYTRRDDVLDFVKSCRGQDGGYGFFPGMDSHINSTHYALLVLAELDALDTLTEGERLDTKEIRHQHADYHAAYTFCAVAALALLGQKADENEDWRLGHWLAERQIPKHGGFNGRPEKAPDVCYSWWITSALAVLGKLHWIDSDALTGFILRAQEEDEGGIADRPGDVPDVFHTFFGLAGLSLLDRSGSFHLRRVDPVWALPVETVRRLGLPTWEGAAGRATA
ncbi:hypothetical protein FOZ60_014425 [Perkinsus olseni]|uniref:Geranylgeranyl transferase type-2 subunit beta n=1 Tax=Perkinsus olseni TaxID=32597 RepID=A0A7J6P745_PEROL|nr:hypothetical protein FOZ60_014425 [Perkinsus olseni]